jgi:thiamine-phosphate pyrophosphorylase
MPGPSQPAGPSAGRDRKLPRVYLITDGTASGPQADLAPVADALAAGVRLVQLREKHLTDRDLVAIARRLRPLTARFGAHLVINGRPDIARLVGADGVHLPQGGLPVSVVRHQLGPDAWIGVSCHGTVEVAAAATAGADFATFGPVFSTPSKAAYGPPLGIAALRHVLATTSLTLFALGGISETHLAELAATGVHGVAAIRALYRPGGVTAFCAAFPPAACHGRD